jgi:hypothetical protein
MRLPLLLLQVLVASSFGQTLPTTNPTPLELHGTCATSLIAPFGAAVVVDSRVTGTNSDGAIVSQKEGCKMLLARPTILLVGVGLADTTGQAGRWKFARPSVASLERFAGQPYGARAK